MPDTVSISRLYVLRVLYLINFALVGSGAAAAFFHRTSPLEPLPGVAYAFWSALALVSGLGLRYPVAMLPVLFLQLLYKLVWIGAVFFPLRTASRSTDLVWGMLLGALLDLVAIPWPYVLRHYVTGKGDPWKAKSRHSAKSEENAA